MNNPSLQLREDARDVVRKRRLARSLFCIARSQQRRCLHSWRVYAIENRESGVAAEEGEVASNNQRKTGADPTFGSNGEKQIEFALLEKENSDLKIALCFIERSLSDDASGRAQVDEALIKLQGELRTAKKKIVEFRDDNCRLIREVQQLRDLLTESIEAALMGQLHKDW